MSSIVGVSSTPFLEVSAKRRAAALFRSADKSHFNSLLLSKPPLAFRQSLSFVASAIATPNSVLSEEAFKGLRDFADHDSSSLDTTDDEVYDEDELAVSKLGLPDRLVQTLESRGITHLFPIQVRLFFFISLFG